MNEEELKKLIENYDKNVLILEKQQEIKKVSKAGILLKSWLAEKQFEAENFMFEEINFLQQYTKTKRRAQKELDFVRLQADKFGFKFMPLAASYANEFYPAAKDNDLNQETIHNLLIAIVEYAAAKRANSEMLRELLSDIADMMKTGTYPENSSLKGSLINIDDEIKETLSRNEKIKSKNKFYQNFANLLHYKYSQQALENINPVIAKINRSENELYDHTATDTVIKNILTGLGGFSGGISSIFGGIKNILTKPFLAVQWPMLVLLGIIPNLMDTIFAKDKKKRAL